MLWRFGGVGAPEGRENVPARCTQNLYHIFSQKFTIIFRKMFGRQGKVGTLTCDFPANVEG